MFCIKPCPPFPLNFKSISPAALTGGVQQVLTVSHSCLCLPCLKPPYLPMNCCPSRVRNRLEGFLYCQTYSPTPSGFSDCVRLSTHRFIESDDLNTFLHHGRNRKGQKCTDIPCTSRRRPSYTNPACIEPLVCSPGSHFPPNSHSLLGLS